PVQENQELIIEALEFHSNFASSFLTEHSNPELLDTKSRIGSLVAEIAGLNREIEKIHLEKLPAGITKAERLS
ncbi:7110_t:CDS:1, partial [Paraglomus brasilianum]